MSTRHARAALSAPVRVPAASAQSAHTPPRRHFRLTHASRFLYATRALHKELATPRQSACRFAATPQSQRGALRGSMLRARDAALPVASKESLRGEAHSRSAMSGAARRAMPPPPSTAAFTFDIFTPPLSPTLPLFAGQQITRSRLPPERADATIPPSRPFTHQPRRRAKRLKNIAVARHGGCISSAAARHRHYRMTRRAAIFISEA